MTWICNRNITGAMVHPQRTSHRRPRRDCCQRIYSGKIFGEPMEEHKEAAVPHDNYCWNLWPHKISDRSSPMCLAHSHIWKDSHSPSLRDPSSHLLIFPSYCCSLLHCSCPFFLRKKALVTSPGDMRGRLPQLSGLLAVAASHPSPHVLRPIFGLYPRTTSCVRIVNAFVWESNPENLKQQSKNK